jgi:hypothetical protein
MGRYISREDVRIRLIGKVRFTESEEDENRMPFILLDKLISEAESEVEHDLSPRYLAPFVTIAGEAFAKLPERPTRNLIKLLCELKSVLLVLDTDFGRGTVNSGEEYAKGYEKRYKQTLDRIMEKKDEGWGWKYPPLPGLQLNYQNREADDGFQGMVLTTGQGDGGFPAKQINDPSENFWNAELDE